MGKNEIEGIIGTNRKIGIWTVKYFNIKFLELIFCGYIKNTIVPRK